jgi:nucleoside-diphosphate-sugar epimerase
MKFCALGRPYEIPYQNEQDYLYAPDVGAAFGHALLKPFRGYAAFTLPSHTVATSEMVEAMREAATELRLAEPFGITVGNQQVPFICDLECQSFLDVFPQVPHTPLKEAVRRSMEHFRDQARRGELQAS